MEHEFDTYVKNWELTPEGKPIYTNSSKLLPVKYKNQPAMLKIPAVDEERNAGHLMIWWDGHGAARILAHDENAFLIERAVSNKSLSEMAIQGRDDEATRVICTVVKELHSIKKTALPSTLIPLPLWFRSLDLAASQYGGLFQQAAIIAKDLLNNPQEIVVLHGDIHHNNILDFGKRGWLAIDPKGLHGERCFDYANLFCNPNKAVATQPARLERQAQIVSQAAGLEYSRLIKWIGAYAALSAAWHLEDGTNPEVALAIAQRACTLSLA